MGGLRTACPCLIPGLVAFALAAPAPAVAQDDLIATFSVCAGRLSALVEHHWLMAQDPVAAEAARDGMMAVLDAVLPPDLAAQSMGWRLSAKAATRALLARADLQDDTAARDRAAVLIHGCRALLLPGV